MVRPVVAADKKYVGITISLPPESVRIIDSGRGQLSRSAFINDLVKKQGERVGNAHQINLEFNSFV